MFNKIKLPTTPEAFDKLVKKILKKYKFSDAHHTAAMVSIAIRHLPATQGSTTLDYFAQYITKSLANYVADLAANNIKHEAQIDQMVAILKNDPNDNQARDALEKARNDGSEYAKKALERLTLPDIGATLQAISAAPLQN